ncbi:MAG: glycoside hydrolase family 3 C-terminal domain-containing protein, partial [Bacteroidaceae bacterium]|nr:glycoside hydrolase family 3 C-terminal domain-containing protein [Bacteroidaceae bacterium]
MEKWARLKYQPNLPLEDGKRVTCCEQHIKLSKEAAAEGTVLLKNDGLLPLKKGTKVALFGKGSFDYVKGGGGSGDVYTSYVRNVYEGLKELGIVSVYEPLSDFYRENVQDQYQKGAAPGMTVEPKLEDALCDLARANAEVALVFISRFSGEGWDRSSVEFDVDFNPWDNETSMPKISEKVF